MKSITTRSLGKRLMAGIGNVTLPSDKDRELYIKRCYRTSSISLLLEDGGVIDNVLVTKSALKDIIFPDTKTEVGSTVVWVNKPKINQPMVIGAFTKHNEMVFFDEDTASLKKRSKTGSAEVTVNSLNNNVYVIANSLDEEGGNIFLVSSNKAKTSIIEIQVSDLLKTLSNRIQLQIKDRFEIIVKDAVKNALKTQIYYQNGEGFNFLDEFDNSVVTNEENIQLDPAKKLNIGTGKEPLALADTLDNILSEFIDISNSLAQACAALTVPTAMGPSGVPINVTDFSKAAADLLALKEQFVNFKSQKSFTD